RRSSSHASRSHTRTPARPPPQSAFACGCGGQLPHRGGAGAPFGESCGGSKTEGRVACGSRLPLDGGGAREAGGGGARVVLAEEPSKARWTYAATKQRL